MMKLIRIGIWLVAAMPVFAQPPADPPKPAPPSSPQRAPGLREAVARQKAAASVQRDAVRRQAESAGLWMNPFDAPKLVETPCAPIEEAVVGPIIESASKAQKVEPKLVRAVIDQESGFHPCATSSRGAKGLMQLMPETADQFSVRDPFDPRQNVTAGATYLKQLLDRYNGDLSQALAAYNAGPKRVDASGGVPDIPETRDYVQSILEKLQPRNRDPPGPPKPEPPKPKPEAPRPKSDVK